MNKWIGKWRINKRNEEYLKSCWRQKQISEEKHQNKIKPSSKTLTLHSGGVQISRSNSPPWVENVYKRSPVKMSHSLTEKSAPPDTRNSLSYRGYSSCGYRRQVTRPLCPNSTLCTGHPEEMKIQTHEVTLTFSMFTPSGHSLNQMTLLLCHLTTFVFVRKCWGMFPPLFSAQLMESKIAHVFLFLFRTHFVFGLTTTTTKENKNKTKQNKKIQRQTRGYPVQNVLRVSKDCI